MTRRSPHFAPTRRRRLTSAAVLAPLAALTLAGCQWTSPVATEKPYEPGDGTSTSMGDLAVNNLLIVADEAGGQGTLVGMGVNNTSQEAEFTFTFEGGEPVSLTVPPYTSAQLSDPQAAGGQMSTIENTPVAPGNLVDVQIDAAGTGAHLARVPVLAPFPPYGDFHEAGPREFAPTPAAHPDGGH